MQQNCSIEAFNKALIQQDINKLKPQEKQELQKVLLKLQNNIHLGKPLSNKNDKNLEGCFKLFFNNAKHRVVYRKIDNNIRIVGIEKNDSLPIKELPTAQIVAIGERDKEHVYIDANNRLND